MNRLLDSEIHKNVLRELQWDSRVDETDVGVEVDNGIVTLTGTVGSYGKRIAAEDAAHRAIGVQDVANNIAIRDTLGKSRTDTELAHAVRFALEWDVMAPDELIQSTVSHGIVTLSGTVANLREREDAVRAIRNLLGVRSVINTIAIKPSPVLPEVVKERIEQALDRHAHRHADREAGQIKVDVRDGKVTLTGSVSSWLEDRAVVGAVRHTPGVEKVEDRLRITQDI